MAFCTNGYVCGAFVFAPPKSSQNINKSTQRAEYSLRRLKKEKKCFALFEIESEFVGGIKGRHKLYHNKQFKLWIQARHTVVILLFVFINSEENQKKEVDLTMKAFVSQNKLKILKSVPKKLSSDSLDAISMEMNKE